jgi:hypothetical protein
MAASVAERESDEIARWTVAKPCLAWPMVASAYGWPSLMTCDGVRVCLRQIHAVINTTEVHAIRAGLGRLAWRDVHSTRAASANNHNWI